MEKSKLLKMLHSGYSKETMEVTFFYLEKEQEIFNSEKRAGKKLVIDDLLNSLLARGISKDKIKKDDDTNYYEIQLPNVKMILTENGTLAFGNRSEGLWLVDDWQINAAENFIFRVNELYPSWQEEWIPIAEECDLYFKNWELITSTIENILEEKLKNKPFEYYLISGTQEVYLNIKLIYDRQLTVKIPHNNYQEILVTIPNEIGEIVSSLYYWCVKM